MAADPQDLKNLGLEIAPALDPLGLYIPASIVKAGVMAHKITDQGGALAQSQLIQKLRIYLSRICKSFPPKGDGPFQLSSGILAPAWYGSRWQEALLGRWGQNFRVPNKFVMKGYELMISQLDPQSCYTLVQASNALAMGRHGLEVTSEHIQEAFRVVLFLQLKYFSTSPDDLVQGEKAWQGLRWIQAYQLFQAEGEGT